jgi:hypothetical protein
MRQRVSGASVASILVIVMLAAASLTQVSTRFAEAPGIDFFYFWAMPTAARLGGHTLGSPYTNTVQYRATLQSHVAASGDPALHAVNRFWSGAPRPSASPLFYTAFAPPLEYSTALRIFRVLQVGAFVGGCVLVGAMYGVGWLPALGLGLVSMLISQPVLSDLRVGNVGTLQFAALAGLLWLASLLPRMRGFGIRAALVAALSAGLVTLVLFKPNIAPVVALLGVHVAVRFGPRLLGLAALTAVPVAAALLIAPCLYFGSSTIWQDWWRLLSGGRVVSGTIAGSLIERGNYATPALLMSWLGRVATGRMIGVFVLVVLGLSLAVAIAWRARREAGAIGVRSIVGAARGVLGDVHATAAIGIVATLAAAPLTWLHYHILLLIPAVWALTAARGGRLVPGLAAASLLANSGVAGLGLWAMGWGSSIPATIALAWIPLWAAVLLVVADPHGESATPPPAHPAPRRSRRRR